METSFTSFLASLSFPIYIFFLQKLKFVGLVVPPNGLWQNHIMTRTHSFIGFFTASYYPTNYTITHLTSSRALMSHSTYSSVLLLTYFLGLILLKGVVYINIQLEGQEDIRNKEKSCGTEAGDQRGGGVNGSRSKFLPKFKPSAYIPKITQALNRSDQSLE